MDDSGYIEHAQEHVVRRRRKRSAVSGWRTIDVHSYACTCGHRTNEYVQLGNAMRARDRHALNGQLSFGV